MLFTHRMHVYLDDVAGGGCMMALMRESSSCGSVAAEHCVRKTIGGLSFFSKHCISKLTGIYTHSENYTLTLISTHHSCNTHTNTNIHSHTFTQVHTPTNIHIHSHNPTQTFT